MLQIESVDFDVHCLDGLANISNSVRLSIFPKEKEPVHRNRFS